MSPSRIVAIIIVYLAACGGWAILGTATAVRSDMSGAATRAAVTELWGGAILQRAPQVRVLDASGTAQELGLADATALRVDLQAEHRRKGLIWHPTFTCDFRGRWRFDNPDANEVRRLSVHFDFPGTGLTYDDFELQVDGVDARVPIRITEGVEVEIGIPAGGSREVAFGYHTTGMGQWQYMPAAEVGRVRELSVELLTNFEDIDFPAGSLPPNEHGAREEGGHRARWQTKDLLTVRSIGVIIPDRINPGPLATLVSFWAPVGLIFFFVLIAALGIVRGIDIHPMHYLFVAAGFGSFHLLFAYLVDHLDVHLGFALAAASALLLNTFYLRAALKKRFPIVISVGGQAFFLVLFSYSFFLKGASGLTIAIGSVLTLAVLMAVTAGIEWSEVFVKRPVRSRIRTAPEEFDPA